VAGSPHRQWLFLTADANQSIYGGGFAGPRSTMRWQA
jgi:hypothetical protein